MNAVSVILYYALTTMRLQRLVFAGYAAAAVAITLLCAALVPAHALLGASAAYAGAMAVLVSFFLASLLLALRRTASRAPAA